MAKEITYRQGDVLLRKIGKLPAGLTEVPRDGRRVVLAYGERTGHAHALSNERVTMFRDTGTGTGQHTYLSISGDADAILRHEEHGAMRVPAGNYEVVGQREETWGAPARVAD